MSAFNARIEPKLYFGVLPKFTLGALFIALPSAVIGVLVDVFLIKWFLIILAGFCVISGIISMVIGRDAPFVVLMLTSSMEDNNVTVETWTKD